MRIRKIYRIENPIDMDGMWYTKNGVARKKIHLLCPDGISKDLPMPFDIELHRKDGLIWNSAGKSIENMREWFTDRDAASLYNNGFRLFEFHTTLYNELEHEILFCRDGVVMQRDIPLGTIWKI